MTKNLNWISENQIAVHAAAKINLYLQITGVRHDGYHKLDSLVGFTNFGDRISVKKGRDITLNIEGPYRDSLYPINDQNLVLCAAKVLASEIGFHGGASITLDKRLPVSSGLGGGSADAAATLHALNELWGGGISDEALAKIGLRLGADVPACLLSETLLMSGVGETVHPVETSLDFGVLLINPGIPISTPYVFKQRDGSFSISVNEEVPLNREDFCSFLRTKKNDLQDTVIELEPQIAIVLDAISAQVGCRLSRMSGSGATCFGIFNSEAAAISAAYTVSSEHTDWWVQGTRFLN